MALLPFMGSRREPERPGHELGVHPAAVRRYLREQLVEEALVLLSCRDYRHCFSVYSGPPRAHLRGRNVRFQTEISASVLTRRRKNARKVAKLARALASLDEHARSSRPAPRHVAKLSLGR